MTQLAVQSGTAAVALPEVMTVPRLPVPLGEIAVVGAATASRADGANMSETQRASPKRNKLIERKKHSKTLLG